MEKKSSELTFFRNEKVIVFNVQKHILNNTVILGCIHLLNTCKYCDNTRKYCGNTHEY